MTNWREILSWQVELLDTDLIGYLVHVIPFDRRSKWHWYGVVVAISGLKNSSKNMVWAAWVDAEWITDEKARAEAISSFQSISNSVTEARGGGLHHLKTEHGYKFVPVEFIGTVPYRLEPSDLLSDYEYYEWSFI